MSTLHPIRGRRTNEELFFEHYSKILGWASQMSHQDKADADDLVQDFYIQVAKMNTRLAEVDEIEPYLFKILRNLHYSRLRQKGRSPIYELSVVDYDSLERSLAAVDRHGLLLVRAQLRSICEFVCQRKNTARSASLFILRFFFGYYPSEVIKLTLTKRAAVDKSLQLAREEAQAFIDRGGDARPSGSREKRGLLGEVGDGSSHDLFSELRQTIFASRQGACFSAQDLDKRYESKAPQRFTVQELAHLVSCRSCLERANAILGLPRLDQRSPDETIGRDNPPGGGSESPKLSVSKGSKRETSRKDHRALERRMREFFEHRPAGLEICVDGDSRAAQPVNAEVTEFYFRLNRAETPEFLEVFSEQCIRLAYLHVREPASCPGLEQRQVVTLSDGRSLELTVSFAKELPTVHVVYRDPVFAQMSALDVESDSNTGMAIVRNGRYDVSADEGGIALCQPSPRFSRVRSGLAALRAWARGLRSPSPSAQYDAAEPLAVWEATRGRSFFTRRRLIFAGAAFFAVVVAACFTLWPRKVHTMTAASLLNRAAATETVASSASTPQVIYQQVRIRTASGQIERTLHRDATGRRKPKRDPLDARTAGLQWKLADAGVEWEEPLSARRYREWHDHAQVTSDTVKVTGDHLLTLTTTVAGAEVQEESLTIRESDFHPIARSISYRDSGTVEIAELDYRVLPWSAESDAWFEPAPQPLSDSLAPRPSLHLPLHDVLSDSELDVAELSVRLALNRLNADSGDQIALTRTTSGIQVKGIVETDARKDELQQALAVLPHVDAAILSYRDMQSRPSDAPAPQSLRSDSVTIQPTALADYLEPKGWSQERIGDLSYQLMRASALVEQESKAIAGLYAEFSSKPISAETRIMLSELLWRHKANLETALAQEQELLGQIDVPNSSRQRQSVEAQPSLATESEKNLALSNELAVSRTAASRSADMIVPEIWTTVSQLRTTVSELPDESDASAGTFANRQPKSREN